MDAISPHSSWWSDAFLQGAPTYAPLKQETRADVAIIGAGITGLIAGRPNETAALVSPSRWKPVAAALNFVQENLNIAKRFVVDRLAADALDRVEEVPAGEGRLVRSKDGLLAAYRDPAGAIHVRSAVCTHAGCIVQWNGAERTWDCPCHGGRFAPGGERIYGPPSDDLHAGPS